MFGHNDDQGAPNSDAPAPSDNNGDAPTSDQTTTVQPQNVMDELANEPINNDAPTDAPSEEPSQAPVADPAPVAPAAAVPAASDDLLNIKQQALTSLSPLLDHLEQSPEERFRTTMMMIQAADNQELIPVAYEAAQQISDEKVRAQALLDIVNEINYFTQQQA